MGQRFSFGQCMPITHYHSNTLGTSAWFYGCLRMSHMAGSVNGNPQTSRVCVDVVFDCGHFSVTRSFSTVGVLNSTLHLLKWPVELWTLYLRAPALVQHITRVARWWGQIVIDLCQTEPRAAGERGGRATSIPYLYTSALVSGFSSPSNASCHVGYFFSWTD